MGGQECSTTKQREQRNSSSSPKVRLRLRMDLFDINLVWMILLGIGGLWWLGKFTDYWETAIGLLGLGGIFAWIAFLSNIVREKRKYHLQLAFEGLFRLKRASMLLGILTLIMILIRLNYGYIAIDSGRDTFDRYIEISDSNSTSIAYEKNLSARHKNKFPVFTGLSGTKYKINVEGLPIEVQQVSPFSPVKLSVPDDFRHRSVVLVRPTDKLSKKTSPEGVNYTLHVQFEKGPQPDPNTMPFRGRTVWIGSGKNLDIPLHLKEEWRVEVDNDKGVDGTTLLRWLKPDVLKFKEIIRLNTDQKIKITVLRDSLNLKEAETDFVAISPCMNEKDFPQVIDIRSK